MTTCIHCQGTLEWDDDDLVWFHTANSAEILNGHYATVGAKAPVTA